MNKKSFDTFYAISNDSIPPVLKIAEKIADSRNIWFVTELNIRNVDGELFPDKSVANTVLTSTISHRHILLIVDDEARNFNLYSELCFVWQQSNGIVLYTSDLSKNDLLEKLLSINSFSTQHRSIALFPTLSITGSIELVESLGYLGTIQKLMVENGAGISDFLDIDLDVLKLNPTVAVYTDKENNNEQE